MIARLDLKKMAREKLQDARVLLAAGRYDSAIYLFGYGVEIALKARICYTLKWPGFPSTRREFEGYQSLRTHDLKVLLHLSGFESKLQAKHANEWDIVAVWDPETRYRLTGSASRQKAIDMVEATKIIVRAL